MALGLRGSPIPTIGLPRARGWGLAIATATVIGLHAGVLLFRLDVSGSSHVSGPHAMAVRFLPSHAVDRAAPREPPVDASLTAPQRAEIGKVAPMGAIDSATGVKLAERVTTSAASVVEPSPPVEPTVTARTAVPSLADAALGAESDYLHGARLDPGPRPIGDIQPEYPDSANLQEGKVVLRILISETGVVDKIAVVRAEPKGLFEDAALDAFRVARFSPGLVLGTPVKSQITVEVEFLPINRGARISGRMY